MNSNDIVKVFMWYPKKQSRGRVKERDVAQNGLYGMYVVLERDMVNGGLYYELDNDEDAMEVYEQWGHDKSNLIDFNLVCYHNTEK